MAKEKKGEAVVEESPTQEEVKTDSVEETKSEEVKENKPDTKKDPKENKPVEPDAPTEPTTIQSSLDSLDKEKKAAILNSMRDILSSNERTIESKISGIASYALGVAGTKDIQEKMNAINSNLQSEKAGFFFQNLTNTTSSQMAIETKISLIGQGLDELSK